MGSAVTGPGFLPLIRNGVNPIRPKIAIRSF
jgi:hypothetical protein